MVSRNDNLLKLRVKEWYTTGVPKLLPVANATCFFELGLAGPQQHTLICILCLTAFPAIKTVEWVVPKEVIWLSRTTFTLCTFTQKVCWLLVQGKHTHNTTYLGDYFQVPMLPLVIVIQGGWTINLPVSNSSSIEWKDYTTSPHYILKAKSSLWTIFVQPSSCVFFKIHFKGLLKNSHKRNKFYVAQEA